MSTSLFWWNMATIFGKIGLETWFAHRERTPPTWVELKNLNWNKYPFYSWYNAFNYHHPWYPTFTWTNMFPTPTQKSLNPHKVSPNKQPYKYLIYRQLHWIMCSSFYVHVFSICHIVRSFKTFKQFPASKLLNDMNL